MENSTIAPFAAPVPPRPKTAPHIRLTVDWLRTQGAQLKPSQFKVYAALLARIGKNPTAWPGHALLAADTGLSVPTVKRALKALKEVGMVGWNPRVERTDRGKMRRTSNEYFLAQAEKFDLAPQVKRVSCPRSKMSDKTVSSEIVKVETKNIEAPPVDVEKAIKSPVSETETLHHPSEDVETWKTMLIAARLSKPDAARYAGPDVPRIIAWWATLDKTKVRLGLLISRLKDPSLLPLPEEALAPPHREESTTPELSIDEKRAWASAHIAACLARLSPQVRMSEEHQMHGMKLSQQVTHLQNAAWREWGETERELMGKSFSTRH